MIFTKLRLKNFKSYENAEIPLNQGISIIVGENGAGKSTILEAMSFALFKQHTAKKIDDLIRKGSNGSMILELEFVNNGTKYRIRREKKLGSSLKSTFYKKSSEHDKFIPISSGEKEVANDIKSVLGIDSDLFLNAIYVRQGEISQLVDKSPAEKKQLIGKLLGIDSLEKAWKNLLPYINNFSTRQAELKGQLQSGSQLDKEYKDKILTLNELKDEGHQLEKDLEEVKELKTKKANEKFQMEQEKSKYDRLLLNLQNEREAYKSIENEKKELVDQLDKIQEDEKEIKKLHTFVKKLPIYLDFEKSVNRIQELKEEEIQINKNLDSVKKQKEIIQNEKEHHDAFIEVEAELEDIKNEKVNLENEFSRITKLEKDKSALLSEIEKSRNEIDKFYKDSKDLLKIEGINSDELNNVNDLEGLKSATNNFLFTLKKKIKDTDNLIITKNKEIATYEGAINSSKKPLAELDEVKDRCPLCQSQIDFKKKNDLIRFYKGNILENERNIKRNNDDIHVLNESKESNEIKVEKLHSLNNDMIEYTHKLSSLEKEITKLDEIDEELDAKEKISADLGDLILNQKEAEEKFNKYKVSYDKFNKAEGALEVLDTETDIQYKLTQNRNEVDNHVRNIKLAINKDSYLTSDIDENELKQRIDDLKAKENKYNQLKGAVQYKASFTTQLTNKKEDLNHKSNKIATLEREIKESKYDKDKYDKLVYSYDVAIQRLEDTSSKLSSIKGQATTLIKEVEILNTKIKENAQTQKEYNQISEYIKLLTKFRELYSKNGIQKDLRNRSRPFIQKYTREYFDKFNFNYSDLSLDEEYEVTLCGPDGDVDLSMVSGGEKIAIALSLRLGITQVLSKGDLKTIMLDEPTIHLDNFRRHELISLLRNMSILPQMIIVTHENELESAADTIIKVEKVNGISQVKLD